MKKFSLIPLFAVGLLAAAPTNALTITPLAVIANTTAETPGGLESDSETFGSGSASATSVSSYTVTDSFGSTTDTVTAAAFQRDDGFSYIELKVDSNGFPNVAATGKLSGYGATADTAFVLDYYNDGAAAVNPIFNFTLSSIAAVLFHGGGGPDPVEAKFNFKTHILEGGDSFSASATAQGNYNDFQLVDANNMSATIVTSDCFFGVCQTGNYIFDDITESIAVGLLNPGERKTVVVEMGAETIFNGTELGAYARIKDPSGGPAFTYDTTFVPVGPTPVPLPASAFLLLGAFGSLVALRRRHRSA